MLYLQFSMNNKQLLLIQEKYLLSNVLFQCTKEKHVKS